MKSLSFVMALSTAVVLFSCEQNEQKEINYMTIQADGRVMAKPDMAVVVVNIQCIDRDIAQSSACMMDKADKVTRVAEELGVDDKDIQSSHIFQNKEYRWNGRTEAFMGYRSSMTTTLTIRDVSVLGKLYPQLLADENLDVGQLQYATSQQDSLKLVAQANAMEHAGDILNNLLGKAGFKTGRVVSVSNVESGIAIPNGFRNGGMAQEESAMDAVANMRAMRINTGQIELKETIYVVYEVE